MASLKDILIKVGVDNRALHNGLRNMERSLKRSGRRMSAIGRNITTNITMPLAAIGTIGIKNYMELEESLTKINTLVGISAEEVNRSAKAIRSLSTEVGKSQKELADALYFIQSADPSRSTEDALKILERTSKASAIGLGETKDVASAVTSVLTAYGDEAYTAAEVTDILTKAVEQGKMEASEFSPALGRVIGVGAQLGVSFEELSANVAMYTRSGVSAEEATTGLRGVLNTLIKATPQMKDRLEALGIPIDKVRDSLREDGLVSTLHMLMEAFDGNVDAMGDVFANVRALANVTFTSGKAFDDYQTVLNEVNNSLGKVDKGFETTSKTTFMNFKRAMVSLENASIDLAGMLIPIFTKILSTVTGFLQWFSQLSPSIKEQAMQWTLYAAAAGGAAFVLGKVLPLLGQLVGAFHRLIKMKFTPLHIALAAVAAIGVYVYKNWDTVKTAIVKVVNWFIRLYNESMPFRFTVQSIVVAFKNMVDVVAFLGKSLKNTFGSIGKIIKAVLKRDFDSIPGLLVDGWEGQMDEYEQLGKNIAENINDGIKNTWKPKELMEIDESDVQAIADNLGKPIKLVKEMWEEFQKFTKSGGYGGPEVPDDTLKPGAITGIMAGAGAGEGEEGLEKSNDELVETSEKIKEIRDGWAETSEKIGRVAEMTQALGELTSTLFDAQISHLEKKYDKERELIENSTFSEEAKAKKLQSIEEKKERHIAQVKTRQAIADKMFAITVAIMETAKAITASMATTGGVSIPFIKAMGAIQIATIAAQPIPKFAKGGIVSSATLGMFGEYPGANAGNPEVVAPLKDLKGMLGGIGGSSEIRLTGGFELSGSNLIMALDRANAVQKRRTGYGT